jgi:hypothetical protein
METQELTTTIDKIELGQKFLDEAGNIYIKTDLIKYERYNHLIPINSVVINYDDFPIEGKKMVKGSFQFIDKNTRVMLIDDD